MFQTDQKIVLSVKKRFYKEKERIFTKYVDSAFNLDYDGIAIRLRNKVTKQEET